jgi:hypothetical protein
MAIIFDRLNKIIEVEAPATEVEVQDIANAIQQWQSSQENLDVPQVAKFSGKTELSSGVVVGITIELLDNWQIKFEDRTGPEWTQCVIKEGNLVGGISENPIATSTFVQVKMIQSAAATIVTTGGSALTDEEHDKLMVTSEPGDAMSLTLSERIALANKVLSLPDGVESSIALKTALSAILSTVAGIATGGGGPNIVFRNANNTSDRVTMVVDVDGNRSSVTINPD